MSGQFESSALITFEWRQNGIHMPRKSSLCEHERACRTSTIEFTVDTVNRSTVTVELPSVKEAAASLGLNCQLLRVAVPLHGGQHGATTRIRYYLGDITYGNYNTDHYGH
jgi:hypothetical protein